MRLLVLSDLHIEHWGDTLPTLGTVPYDAVVIAGDIWKGTRAIAWAGTCFTCPVLYVAGNHEAYGDAIDTVLDKLKAAADKSLNVVFLNCNEAVFDGVRFVGATLWTDFKLYGDEMQTRAMNAAEQAMNDYHVIRVAARGYRRLSTTDTLGYHLKHRFYIEGVLSRPFEGKTVVITHMAPSIKSVHPKYGGDSCNPYYASNLEGLVARADLWIHGHTHSSFDYQIGKCRVVCNPCGYPYNGRPENAFFNPNLIVEI